MLEQLLIIGGASIFGILGIIHLIYTFYGDKFYPYQEDVHTAMQSTNPKISKETTMWKAWLGFNASHSLGAILLAAIYLPLASYHMEIITAELWFNLLPVIFSLSFVVLAKRYWFKIPFFGIALAFLCFSAASLLINS